MSPHETENHDPATAEHATDANAPAADKKLTDLMASGDAPARAQPNLDADALRAAKEAIAEGERALAQARAQLAGNQQATQRQRNGRELAIRFLLAANVLAMIVVVLMPSLVPLPEPDTLPTPPVASKHDPVAPGPKLNDRYNQALALSDKGDFAGAIEVLEQYLQESPRMAPSRLVSVYQQISYYASSCGRFEKSEEYRRKALAVTQSHQLPDDLLETAKAALASGDQQSLRQVWARFLLIQREIPPSLYQHVAEAYLQLGDSYRLQANAAAEKARLAEIERANALLIEQGKGEEKGRK